jgi:hypothetical protein
LFLGKRGSLILQREHLRRRRRVHHQEEQEQQQHQHNDGKVGNDYLKYKMVFLSIIVFCFTVA